jgi:membrane-bound metal-dependent hydrolase YbcI (DUF457 family)
MFVGHLAVALAGARVHSPVSAGWFVAAATLLDLLWPLFLLAGLERVRIAPGATAFTPFVFESYPWSHSLLMVLLWGAAFATLARWRGIGARTAGLLCALVVSHWVLDFVTHAPDMPLWPGSARFGLGLWNSIPATLLVEGALWIGALVFYLRGRWPRGAGAAALWSFVAVSSVMWILGPFTPPPADERALGWFALIGWIVVPWVAWADDRVRRF